MKTKLNLACGNRIEDPSEWLNHDIKIHREEIEVAHDLTELPWPWEDNTFEEIIAKDILEHLPNIIKPIEELWRISKPDAKIFVHTAWASPEVDARLVWLDPTHVRPFHENTFHYFDPIHGGWLYETYGSFYTHARFEILGINEEPPYNIGFLLRVIKEEKED